MEEKEKLVLTDKNVVPGDDLIFSILGDKKILWLKIMRYAHDNYKEITEEWRYYNDGKQWLFKMQQKKKTIFWIGILKDTFRITFYFGDKAAPLIENSDLPQSIKDDFRITKRFGSLRAITIRMSGPSDLDNIFRLIDIKLKLK